eukprot:TRINITY_DN83947_c0_g1_i1.p1 TRINITY_DN83947_c0_g1~~TRINITY_DN83947_c0_g1_i1.p1  ORF type:complete len:171 (+),score=28.17 TRINITY_DN83947_c0_g1_i1:50-514(+)
MASPFAPLTGLSSEGVKIDELDLPPVGLVLSLKLEEEIDVFLSRVRERWVVLELSSKWSAASLAMSKAYEAVAKSNPEGVFLRGDIASLPGLATKLTVTRVPSYVIFWDGVEETRFSGASDRKLRQVIEDCFELGAAKVAANPDPAGGKLIAKS